MSSRQTSPADSFLLLPSGLLMCAIQKCKTDFQEQGADSSLPQTSASWAGAVGCQALPGAQSCLSPHRPAEACACTPRQEVGTRIRPENRM